MSVKAKPTERDDPFSQIRGIGAGIERRLHQAHIHTFGDLAAKTPAELAGILKGLPGITQESPQLKSWIQQAGELAGPPAIKSEPVQNPRPMPEEAHQPENLAHYENFTVILRMGEDNQVNRTRVMHVQDASERAWTGWDGQKLLDFIAAHAGLQEPQEAQPSSEEGREINPHLAGIPASGNSGSQMPETAVMSQPSEHRSSARAMGEFSITKMEVKSVDQSNSSRILRQGEAFHVCLGLKMDQVDRPAGTVFNYSAAIFAHELSTRTRQKVAAGQGKLTLASQADIEFKGNPLPSGLYRFEAVVMLTEEGSPDPAMRRTAFLDGGLFQVD